MTARRSRQDLEDLADKMAKHAVQVAEGLIPEDSPPDFVKPEDGLIAVGSPWWWPGRMTDEQKKQFLRFAQAAAEEHDADVKGSKGA
jgi:hypothetical protein